MCKMNFNVNKILVAYINYNNMYLIERRELIFDLRAEPRRYTFFYIYF